MSFRTVSLVLFVALGVSAQYGGNQLGGGQNVVGGDGDIGQPPPPPPSPQPIDDVTDGPTAGGDVTDAPTDVDATDATLGYTPSDKKCPSIETPKKSECADTWVPVHDTDYCIASFECKVQEEDTSEDAEGDDADSSSDGSSGEDGNDIDSGDGGDVEDGDRPCEDLNPFTNSDVDRRKSDSRCETGNPGWGGDKSCRCVYPVQTRDDNDCATRFWRVCYKTNADGSIDEAGKTTCPPLVFPEDKENCMIVKRIIEGCEKLEHMCMEPAEETPVDGDAPGVLPPVAPVAPVAPVDAPVAPVDAPVAPVDAPVDAQVEVPAQTQPGPPGHTQQKQEQSGYRGRFARH